jgi:hypothetical protein
VATADEALEPGRWKGAGVAEILSAVIAFLVRIYREQRGLIRAFVVHNHRDAAFAARQERLSHHVSAALTALLLARRAEIGHPRPETAARFGLALVFGALESAILFGEMRAVPALSDDSLAAELTRAYLAYLGVDLPDRRNP